ncbi:YqiA/YcfP family alpha/beta fold hydrolase [Thalassotalea sp. G2M2-11]|uniref:YqiA/YcfP family alpha/beta fold hydrolase n=1 Tax=Thalassotalea sp. G2M2-11 TaxID=2787627 RepID=UPI0019D06B53|nr:YqiA/YcfP family alpha/beta fold hydrolase [Thalassotalea sp. G2M2-11]
MKAINILYIHGFNSSPMSQKAVSTKQYIEKYYPEITFYCPQVIFNPKGAIAQLEAIVESAPSAQWFVMGSSLGGYFSSYLAEKYDLPAVLINPAVRPFELLVDYIGEQQNPYTGEVYQVTDQYMTDLQALYNEKISKKRYMVMVQTGDEVLDYQQAVDKYQDSQLIVQQGGDHSFIHYEQMLPKIMAFFPIANKAVV